MDESTVLGIKSYLKIATAGGARWHPFENKIIFTYDYSGNFQIYEVEIEEDQVHKPIQLTFSEDRSTDGQYLSDGTIIFQRDHGGNENFQIIMYDPKEEKEYPITNSLDSKCIILFSTDKFLYYRANIDKKSKFDIYRHKIPLLENEAEKIYSPKKGLPYSLLTEDDNNIILTNSHGNVNQEILLHNIEKDETLNLTNHLRSDNNYTYRWEAIRFIDETDLLVATDYDSDISRLMVLDLNGNIRPIANLTELYEYSTSTYNRNDNKTLFSFNDEGYDKLYSGIFVANSVTNLEEIELPKKGVLYLGDSRSFTSALSLSSDGKYLALTFSAPNLPTIIWIRDMEKKNYWKAVDYNSPEIDPKTFVDAKLFRFDSFDGLSVPYFLYIPHTPEPDNGYPIIIYIHGGPESQIKPNFNPIIQFFLAAGYAVATPNIRGSTGYGREYMDLDNKEKRLDAINDIAYLARVLRETSHINAEKIVLYGGSYGGFAVLSALTEHPDLWAAAIDIVGISNFITFLENTAEWRRALREAEYGSLDDDLELLKRISPINKIDNIKAPLFIIHGDNDERVPISETIQIYEQMKKKNLNVRLIRFDNEGHGITNLDNKITAYSEIIEWLNDIIKVT